MKTPLTLQTKGAAEATPFSYRPERFRSHRSLHQATTTELITPPTILNTPRNEIISHPREESIKSQREKYSGKKVHAYHTVK